MKRGQRTEGGVEVEVKGKNITVTPALHDQVVHKMHRLDRYLDRLNTIEVELCTEKTRDSAHKNTVEATAHVAGRTLRVTAVDGDMYAAIDEAVDKLHRQLSRQKERMKAHHGARVAEVVPGETIVAGSDADEVNGAHAASEPEILIERQDMEPMFQDEALEEMLAAGHNFFVFLNARNETVNVLYRHDDGSYGLIEPRVG